MRLTPVYLDVVPVDICCPITLEPIIEPVVCADGKTYEKQAIEAWLETHDTSPSTNEKLPHKLLTPNHDYGTLREVLLAQHHSMMNNFEQMILLNKDIKDFFLKLLKDCSSIKDIKCLFQKLSADQRPNILMDLSTQQVLTRFIKTREQFEALFAFFEPYGDCFFEYHIKLLPSLLTDINQVIYFWDFLNDALARKHYIEPSFSACLPILSNRIKSACDFRALSLILTPGQGLILIQSKTMDHKLIEIITDPHSLKIAITYLSAPQCTELCFILGNALLKILPSQEALNLFLTHLEKDQSLAISNAYEIEKSTLNNENPGVLKASKIDPYNGTLFSKKRQNSNDDCSAQANDTYRS